jgi:hypothetical protein
MQRLLKATPEQMQQAQDAYRQWWESNGYKWGIWLFTEEPACNETLRVISFDVVNMFKNTPWKGWMPSFDHAEMGLAGGIYPTGARNLWHREYISAYEDFTRFRGNLQHWLHSCVRIPEWKGITLLEKLYNDFLAAEIKVNQNFHWRECKFFELEDDYINRHKLLACLSSERATYLPAGYSSFSCSIKCNDPLIAPCPTDETGCCVSHRDASPISFGTLGFDDYVACPYFISNLHGTRSVHRQIKGFSTETDQLVNAYYAPLDNWADGDLERYDDAVEEVLLTADEEWWIAKNELESVNEMWQFGKRHISKLYNRLFLKQEERHSTLIHPMAARFSTCAAANHERSFFVLPRYIGDTEVLNPWYEDEVDWSQLILSNLNDSDRDTTINTLKHLKSFINYVDYLAGDECTGGIVRTENFDWCYLMPEPLYDAIFAVDRGTENTMYPCHDIKHGTNTMWLSYVDRFEGGMSVTCDFCMEAKPGLMTRMFAHVYSHYKTDFNSIRDTLIMTATQLNIDALVQNKTDIGCIDYTLCDHLYCTAETSKLTQVGFMELDNSNHIRACFGCIAKRFSFCHQLGTQDESTFGFGLWHLQNFSARTTKSARNNPIVID